MTIMIDIDNGNNLNITAPNSNKQNQDILADDNEAATVPTNDAGVNLDEAYLFYLIFITATNFQERLQFKYSEK